MSSLAACTWLCGSYAYPCRTFFNFPSSTTTSTSSLPPFIIYCCNSQNDFKFVLHDALDTLGVNTTHARIAREGFCSQIRKLSNIERETSICINRGVDLGKAALHIAAEDDSLVSHSSVPLPVDDFLERLDHLSMGYCSRYSSSFTSSPQHFIHCLEKYLYVNKGFRRAGATNQSEPRALYLHSVLTHRSGSASLLSLLYSEILKMLRLWGLLSFDIEVFFPHDSSSSPRGYCKQKTKESDQSHVMTAQSLLEEAGTCLRQFIYLRKRYTVMHLFVPFPESERYSEEKPAKATCGQLCCSDTPKVLSHPCLVLQNALLLECPTCTIDIFEESEQHRQMLKDLKDAFWPFQLDHTKSLFLRAARAANCSASTNDSEESAFELASVKADLHRLERGVWTNVRFGDMRRALSACERLILLQTDPKELRDYGALLYHCGFYKEALQYLTLYQDRKKESFGSIDNVEEEEAMEKLMIRLNLILMEEGWSLPQITEVSCGTTPSPGNACNISFGCI